LDDWTKIMTNEQLANALANERANHPHRAIVVGYDVARYANDYDARHATNVGDNDVCSCGCNDKRDETFIGWLDVATTNYAIKINN
jgi:hypothetical protein